MANQYLQKFSTVSQIPTDKGNAAGLGVVDGAIVLRGSGTPGSFGNSLFNSAADDKTIRLNSRTYVTATSGDIIGFQSKPRLGVGGSQTMYGYQVSAQVSNAIATTGSIIGAHVDVYLRGTSAGAIGGDVRGLQIELTTDDAGTRDITGHVTALRIRKAFSAGTVSGKQSVIRIEKPEVQTGSESYDCVFQFTSSISDVWDVTGDKTGTPAGYIAVMFDTTKKYIQTYT